jgi:hypothetical protein
MSSTHCPAPLVIFHGHQSIIDPIHNTLAYMAGGSASSSGSFIPVVLQPTTEKLGKNNHTTWRVQVLATLRGACLDGYVTGKKKAPATELEKKQGDQKVMVANPEYEDWLASDQQVFIQLHTCLRVQGDLGLDRYGDHGGTSLGEVGRAVHLSN